jgi:hypothetical protein
VRESKAGHGRTLPHKANTRGGAGLLARAFKSFITETNPRERSEKGVRVGGMQRAQAVRVTCELPRCLPLWCGEEVGKARCVGVGRGLCSDQQFLDLLDRFPPNHNTHRSM